MINVYMYSMPKQFSKLFLPCLYLNARLLVGVLFCGGHVLFCFVFAKSVIYVNTPEGEQPGTKYKRSVQRLDPYTASPNMCLEPWMHEVQTPKKVKSPMQKNHL